MSTLVWLRDDLRITDNPALCAAADRGEPVTALFVLDEVSPGIRPLGGAARWWLHHSLSSLGDDLAELGIALVLRRGPAERIVPEAVRRASVTTVFWNRRYGGPERRVDSAIKSELRDAGLEVASFQGSLLFEPWTVRTGSDTHYRVFTPFWKAALQLPPPRAPFSAPTAVSATDATVPSDELDEWGLLPRYPNWSTGLAERWEPGESAARERLRAFLADDLDTYAAARDEPAAGATSELSPRLRWGELSPFTVWHEAVASGGDVGTFLSELGWREFAWHTLFHAPDLHTDNLNARYDKFPWPTERADQVTAWQRGETGYALVDAGMRELWQSGVMHNRVRMVAASFLTKNLLVHWQTGEAWFWDTLVDADAASNPFNWQWVAGSGADAAPYFRVFNPETQRAKFDPTGQYVATWAPEYVDDTAPEPIVDLKATRQRALDAYEQVRNG